MKNIFKSILACIIAFSIFSCNDKKPESKVEAKERATTIEITHELGKTQVKINPEKLVVFDIGSFETIDYLGLGDKIVGAPKTNLPSHLSRYNEKASIVDVGTVKEANFEKISELNPDLIIISTRLQSSYKELSKIAPTIYLSIDNKDYLNSFKRNAIDLGKIFNKEEQIKNELAKIDEEIKTGKEKIEKLEGKGLIVLYNNRKFSAYGSGSRFGFIHDVLGVKQSDDEIEVSTHGQAISSEFIENMNPDYLFIVDRGVVVNRKDTNKAEIENDLIKQTKAFKNGKIIYLNPEIWYLSGGGIFSVKEMIKEASEIASDQK